MALTLDQISQFVCGKVGQTDAASLALCYTYVNMRFRMIYESFPWRDSQIIPTDVNTVPSQAHVLLPSGIDRVISIRCNGSMLEPTNSTQQLEINPTYFDTTGTPLYYEEYTEVSDNSKRIRLFPIPNAVFALKIIAKRTPNTLSISTDTPILRNIDNVLIAYAMGDMLERQRQYGKAAEKFKEAGALLEAAKQLESAQTNAPRTTKNITVSGNSLLELTDAICARIGDWSQETRILAREFLRRNYVQVYDSNLWTESTVEIDVTSVTGVLVLPEFIDRIISIRGVSTLGQLSAEQPSLFYAINPWIFEQTGDPLSFSYLAPVAVTVLPTSAQQLTVVSTSAADKSNVFIRGEQAGGTVVSETLTLNGLTPVNTGQSYLTPLTIAKNITSGTVAVTGSISLTQYVALLANERERKHIRIQFRPTPTSNVTCKVLCKRKCTPFSTDEDTPLLRDIGNTLIDLACADMFAKIGNADAATGARSKAGEALKTMIDLERNQGANSYRVVPQVEYSEADWIDSDAWIVAKS
jgi:hypothetical protein